MLVQPRLEWRTATVRENREETAQARTLASTCRTGRGTARDSTWTSGSPPTTAIRPSARLDRLGAGERRARADGRADRRRRGLALSHRGAGAGRRVRAAGADRRLLRLGDVAGRPAPARRGRLRARAADGDAAPPPPGGERRRGPGGPCPPEPSTTCSTATSCWRWTTAALTVTIMLTRGGSAAGLERLHPTDRQGDARGGGARAGRHAARLRLRPHAVRRGGRPAAGGAGPRAARVHTERFGPTGG